MTSEANSIGVWTRSRKPACKSARWKNAHRLPYFASVSLKHSCESTSRLSARTRRICLSVLSMMEDVTYLAIVHRTGFVEIEAPLIECKSTIWGDDDGCANFILEA